MKINTLIIDDEEIARKNLSSKLKILAPDIKILGEGGSVDEAMKLLKIHDIHLLFLDITMPNESGLTLLNKIEDIAFEIIFVTAHDEYALKAFEFSASGYILKPIDNMMLKQALNTAIDRIKLKDQYRSITSLKNYINNKMEFAKLAIPMEFGFEFVYTYEVIRLESEDGYTNVILDNKKKILSSKGLAYFKKIIPTTTFVQIHRSYIVNLDYVEKYLKSGNVVMKDASIIPVSRNSKDEFLALFM